MRARRVSRFHVEVPDGRPVASKIAGVLRRCGYDVRAHGVRARGRAGGWKWVVSYIDHEWLASLIRACLAANPWDAEYDLDLALEDIHRTFDGDDEAVDSLWRLGGYEAIVKAARNAQGLYPMYRSLGFTWSFDPEGVQHREDVEEAPC